MDVSYLDDEELLDARELSPEPHLGESYDQSLRPENLSEYIGQHDIKNNLSVFIEASKKRKQALDHVLLSGPPGLGKTTLANILAYEMNAPIKSTSGPVLERQGDLAAILTNLEPGSVLFIDEIHRMNRVVEEVLYSAMEDFTLDIIIGQGPSARTIKLDIPRFTLVGATTRSGLLSTPLRDRFGIQGRLNYYEAEDLKTIVTRSASILEIEITDEAALALATRSRGTPRISNRLLRRCRDFADLHTQGVITDNLVGDSLGQMGVDELGLDHVDRLILESIVHKFEGGPVGLNTLCAVVSEEKDTIEDVYEPYLLMQGLIQRTPRGRVVTALGYKHLGVSTYESTKAQQMDFL